METVFCKTFVESLNFLGKNEVEILDFSTGLW